MAIGVGPIACPAPLASAPDLSTKAVDKPVGNH
jgi:hypothetical protein